MIGKHIGPYHFGHWPMNLVNQPPGSMLCVPAATAMLARTTIEDVLDWDWEPDDFGLFGHLNAVKFLADRRITLGAFFHDTPHKVRIDKTVLKNNAMLAVSSKSNPGLLHCVVWDAVRQRVLDPMESCPQPLAVYDGCIEQWFPLVYWVYPHHYTP